MKICIITRDFSVKGGAEKVATNLANQFCQKHDITFVSCFFTEHGIPAYSLDSRISPFTILVPEGLRLRSCFLDSYRKLRNVLKKNGCQIIILVSIGTTGFLPAMLGLNIPIIICEHTNLKNKLYISGFFCKIQRIFASIFADKIVTLTKQDAECYKKKYCLPEKKVTHIYNWIDPSIKRIFNQSNITSQQILSLGRFDPVKGYDYLIQVGQLLMNYTNTWEWHIYGQDTADGTKADLIKKIEKKNLQNYIFLHEAVNNIEPLFQNAAILALTSIYEGLPMVLLEAKGYGFPLVAFDCPTGPSEIITDNVNGYLVKCYDCELMAKKIAELLNNPELRLSFAEQSQFDIQRFSMESILQQWEHLFAEFVPLQNRIEK